MTTSRRFSFYNTASAAEHYLGIRWGRRVWQAVLEQAISDVVEGAPRFELEGMSAHMAAQTDGDLRVAAREWIEDDVNEPRRFVWVCEQLDLDPEAVREAIKRRMQ